MTDDKLPSFFQAHKEPIPGEAFNARLFNTLDYLPQPRPRSKKAGWIIACSTLVGFLLFVLLGGYGIVLSGLSAMGSVFVDAAAFTPNVLTACICLVLVFAALTGFAVRSYRQ